MAGKIATRAAYGEALVELAEQYPELVVFDADLSNATMTKGFAAKYPERFFDMGIAECNMTGVAAGMSTCGFKPFTNTFAIFASGLPGSRSATPSAIRTLTLRSVPRTPASRWARTAPRTSAARISPSCASSPA